MISSKIVIHVVFFYFGNKEKYLYNGLAHVGKVKFTEPNFHTFFFFKVSKPSNRNFALKLWQIDVRTIAALDVYTNTQNLIHCALYKATV